MRLTATRTYEDLGGTRYFVLASRLEFDDEEQALASRYDLGEYVLIPGHPQGVWGPATANDLGGGDRKIFRTLPQLIAHERALQSSCIELSALFDYCQSFDAEQVIDIQA